MHRVSWARYGLGILTKNGNKNGNKNGTDTHTTHQGSRAKNPHLTAILLTMYFIYLRVVYEFDHVFLNFIYLRVIYELSTSFGKGPLAF